MRPIWAAVLIVVVLSGEFVAGAISELLKETR